MIRLLFQKGFFHLLSANFLTQFLGFGTLLFIAKILTPVEVGQIKILQSYAALFIVLAAFGSDTAILRCCAENRPQAEKVYLLRLGLRRAGLATVVALALMVALTLSGLLTSTRQLGLWLLFYSLCIPFAVSTSLLTVFLQSLKRIKEMARVQTFVKLQSVFLIVVCTWIWHFPGFIISSVIAYMVGLFPMIHQVGLRSISRRAWGAALEEACSTQVFSKIALFSVLANGISIVSQYSDIFVLDHFSSNRAGIGYYSLATIFLLGATQITATVQSFATPYLTEKITDEMQFRQLLAQNQIRLAALSVGVASLVLISAWLLVPRVYGPDYAPTLGFLGVLMLKYIFASSCALVGVAILSLGLPHYSFYVYLVLMPISVILSYVLLRHLGLIGVAWAQAITALLNLSLSPWLIRRAWREAFTRKTTAVELA